MQQSKACLFRQLRVSLTFLCFAFIFSLSVKFSRYYISLYHVSLSLLISSLKKFISMFSLNLCSHNIPQSIWNNYFPCHSVHFIICASISALKRFYIQYNINDYFFASFFPHFSRYNSLSIVFIYSFLRSLSPFLYIVFLLCYFFVFFFLLSTFYLFFTRSFPLRFFPFSPSLFLSFFFLHLTRATCKSVVADSFPVSHVLLILGYLVVRYLLFSRF